MERTIYENDITELHRILNLGTATTEQKSKGFICACQRGHVEIVNLLIQEEDIDLNANNYGQTGFIWACVRSHVEIVNLLIQQEEIDLNAKDITDRTGFIIACEEGNVEIVNLLIQQEQIDINVENVYCKTGFEILNEKNKQELIFKILNQIEEQNRISYETVKTILIDWDLNSINDMMEFSTANLNLEIALDALLK